MSFILNALGISTPFSQYSKSIYTYCGKSEVLMPVILICLLDAAVALVLNAVPLLLPFTIFKSNTFHPFASNDASDVNEIANNTLFPEKVEIFEVAVLLAV